jgi:chromate transporter
VATGLILASAFSVLRSSSSTWMIWGLAAIALVIFLVRPKLNPLIVLFAAGLLNAAMGPAF